MDNKYLSRINLILSHFNKNKNISIIGITESHGQPINGCDITPIMIKEKGLLKLLSKDNVTFELFKCKTNDNNYINVNSYGDIIKNSYIIGEYCYNLYLHILEKYRNTYPIIIGGDHSISCGTISSALTYDNNIGVIWIDAHADINTPDTSKTMNLHGMPLSFLLGLTDYTKIRGFEWMNNIPKLNPKNLIYIGLRDIDDDELKFIKDLNIKTYTMDTIKNKTIECVLDEILLYLSHIDNLHISWDIDSIDPIYAPCTGTKVDNGLSINECICISKTLSKYKNIRSIDMVEINTKLSDNINDINRTLDIANYIIYLLMR
jgi:arginase